MYYWRVTAVNACGSQVSSISAFRTAATSCTTYASTDVPKTISDVQRSYEHPEPCPKPTVLTDVNVTIGSLIHT